MPLLSTGRFVEFVLTLLARHGHVFTSVVDIHFLYFSRCRPFNLYLDVYTTCATLLLPMIHLNLSNITVMYCQAGVDSDNILACATILEKAEKMPRREALQSLIVNQMHRFLGAKKHQQEAVAGSWYKKCMTSCLHCCGSR